MKKFNIRVECEYYLTIEAESLEDAIEIAETGEGQGYYDLSDLQNFEYYNER